MPVNLKERLVLFCLPTICCFISSNFNFSQLQFSTSVESRTEKLLSVPTSVRTMPLILANSYQITSILHTVLSTITECFYRRKKFEPPIPLSPSPFFGYCGVFFSETLGHRFQPIWDFPVWIFIFLASLGLSLGVIFFDWPNFHFWALQVLEIFWAQNLRREIRLSNGDQSFSIWSVSR